MSLRASIELSRKELYRRVWSEPLSAVAKDVGLSGSALAKICNRMMVPYPTRGYWVRVAAGQKPPREPLPAAPEKSSNDIVFSPNRVSSRRSRTRLDPGARRDQLLKVAEDLITQQGLHAATMKRIAAIAGISETQSYNYFRSREELFGELARREFARITDARAAESSRTDDHYERITRITRAYLRHIGQRGRLLQMLLGNPGVRALLRKENRDKRRTEVQSHSRNLMSLYGIPKSLAYGATVVLTTLCMRAGKVIADGKIPEEVAERLCLTLLVQGSRDLINPEQTPSRAREAL